LKAAKQKIASVQTDYLIKLDDIDKQDLDLQKRDETLKIHRKAIRNVRVNLQAQDKVLQEQDESMEEQQKEIGEIRNTLLTERAEIVAESIPQLQLNCNGLEVICFNHCEIFFCKYTRVTPKE
jgi:hypothetical protein